jgi:hypothetical protein
MAFTSTHTISPHALQRMAERQIQPEAVTAVLSNRRRSIYRSHPGNHATWRYRHLDEQGLVVVTDGPVVVTVFRCEEQITGTAA